MKANCRILLKVRPPFEALNKRKSWSRVDTVRKTNVTLYRAEKCASKRRRACVSERVRGALQAHGAEHQRPHAEQQAVRANAYVIRVNQNDDQSITGSGSMR